LVLRLRNVPGAREILQSTPDFILEPENLKGKWAEHFNNSHPIHIEIGSGKGKFVTTLALQNKDINFIAIEKFATVLLKLVKKIPEEGYPNLAILNSDAEMLTQFFEPGEIHKIYLNFSDPWPRKRHEKRRLTHVRFLETFKSLLKSDGTIAFKTDNHDLFDFSIGQFELAGYLLEDITYDLHHSPLSQENVTTEYEEKFISQGMPIYGLTAYKNNLYPAG
jgi:tRNA (guanine-N7-)-methyltransferase